MRLGISFSLINKRNVIGLLSIFCLCTSFALYSDNFPEKGLKMEEVKAQFGSPIKQNPAIGKPPIIRWDYSNYSVYFEKEYVIHSVPHQRKLNAESNNAAAPSQSSNIKVDSPENTSIESTQQTNNAESNNAATPTQPSNIKVDSPENTSIESTQQTNIEPETISAETIEDSSQATLPQVTDPDTTDSGSR
jgi:hypothetical protein